MLSMLAFNLDTRVIITIVIAILAVILILKFVKTILKVILIVALIIGVLVFFKVISIQQVKDSVQQIKIGYNVERENTNEIHYGINSLWYSMQS